MGYFAKHYSELRFPIQDGEVSGLRPPQLGALHAIGAHFAVSKLPSKPAIVTLPTGTGKSVVLLATPFLLRSQRVLVITPSRLLREQLAEQFSDLQPLKDLSVVGEKMPAPRVKVVRHRVLSAAKWEELRKFDVVISTPHTLAAQKTSEDDLADEQDSDQEAESRSGATDPSDLYSQLPASLFDTVMIDEAHHAPASRWKAVLQQTPAAHHVLFTATPFRRDKKALPGKIIYTYHLRDAFRDGYFGKLRFQPVTVPLAIDPDIAIARAALAAFLSDVKKGFHHSIMVRSASRKKANQLYELYRKEVPSLRLAVVTGDKSLVSIRSTLAALKKGDLDGVVCVDMLGEGFDFPRLKLAALHSPHKSLGVTLQFVGRFARTKGKKLGPATFLAVPSEIRIERESLYAESAIWETLIPNLSEAAVAEEVESQEALASFEATDRPSLTFDEESDLSAFSLRPHQHVRVYDVGNSADIAVPITFPRGVETVRSFLSEEEHTAVYVTKRRARPDWTEDARFDAVRYDLFMIYYHAASGLLFVSASDRSPAIYAAIAAFFPRPDGSEARPVSHDRLSRVLLDVDKIRVYSLGLRSRRPGGGGPESYRISGGRNVLGSINSSVVTAFRRGHVFTAGVDAGESVAIGLSSSSKVWSTGSLRVPALARWCAVLAKKMMRKEAALTNSNLDKLSAGQELPNLPQNLLFADWPVDAVTTDAIAARYQVKKQGPISVPLLDLSFSIDRDRSTNKSVMLVIEGDGIRSEAAYSPFDSPPITPVAKTGKIVVHFSTESETGIDIWEFLTDSPPVLYTTDLDSIEGRTLYPRPRRAEASYDASQIETWDWETLKVDIKREFKASSRKGFRSIHAFLEQQLGSEPDLNAVLYDHASGEVADFLTVKIADDAVAVRLWHCKGAKGEPSERVGDWYEILGQGARSYALADREWLLKRIIARCSRENPSRFIRGDLNVVRAALTDPERRMSLGVILVQPGLKVSKMTPTIGGLLTATHSFLAASDCRFQVIASP